MTRRRGWFVAIALIVLAQLALIALWYRLEQNRSVAGLQVAMEVRSEPGHDLRIERPGGSPQFVPARSDGFQLVHFWATWCPPCRQELPTLLALERRERQRLRVWIISTDPDWAAIRRFFRGSIPSTVYRDPGGGYRAYGVTALPDTYLLAPNGRVVARFAGGQHWNSQEMARILDRLIRDS